MKKTIFSLAGLLAAVLAGSLLFLALDLKRGYSELGAKRQHIRDLEQRNAELKAENRKKRERIDKLRYDQRQQELEIRERQKKVRQGETTFVLQDQKKQ
ncbi:MAG: septum formation initiator family protein [Acidobacteriota bacterium]